MRALLALLLLPVFLPAAGVTVVYDPANPETGPFPSDVLTVADATQQTGRRMQMPLPDCNTQPSTCGELTLINQFDGFALNPRLRIRFSGPVNPDTLKAGLRLVSSDGQAMAVNQVVYDPQTNTAFAQPDVVLRENQRYTLQVTDLVKDAQGDSVQADAAFTRCLSAGDAYCTALRAAVGSASSIRGASLFTTMAATRFLAQATSNAGLLPVSATAQTFSLRTISSITWHQEVATSGPQTFNDQAVPSPGLLNLLGFGRIALGTFPSWNYLDSTQIIPAAGGNVLPASRVSASSIAFYAWLPASPAPPGGYPVVLAGHGIFDDVFGMPLSVSLTLLNRGFAVVTFSPVGHGYGPNSTIVLTGTRGQVTEVPFPGRAVDLDGNGQYDNGEGCLVIRPGAPINVRDCLRQTALDFSALAHAIHQGMDLDSDGQPDLDGSRINYVGHSLGSFYGTMVSAISPDVTASVLNAGGGSAIGTARISQSFRQLITLYLAARTPNLLNKFFDFDDNFPLRDQPVRVNTVTGALEIQDTLARAEWIETPGAPYAYAPLIKPAGKRVMFQIGIGDQTVPNPSNSQLIRAAGGLAQTSVYRHDLARSAMPRLPANPHTFLVNLDDPSYLIALTAQEQIARFLLSGQLTVPDVNPLLAPYFNVPLFEVPTTLPETLSFQQP